MLMTTRILIPLLLLACTAMGHAQQPTALRDATSTFPEQKEKCGRTAMHAFKQMTDPGYAERRQQIEAFTRKWIQQNAHKESAAVLTVPVVVHVIYADASQNISDAQIHSQMDILNKDFRRTNSDASNTPTDFQSIAADTEIEFCLASIDPNGAATNGITRTSTSVSQIGNGAYFQTANGGKDGWDPNKYLNIWVCEIESSGGILGFAWPPGTASPQEDGAVIDYRYFGTMGTAQAPFNLGRTATHEVGHYLNLEHIWGINGGCGDDDGVNDTPNQEQDNFGCPSHPSNSCNTADMFMNYMDYTDDVCMNAFSAGQKARMRAALNGPRAALLTSGGCATTVAVDPGVNSGDFLTVFPNPARGSAFVAIKGERTEAVELNVYNILGARMLHRQYDAAPEQQVHLNLSDYAAGIYLVEVHSAKRKAAKKLIVQ